MRATTGRLVAVLAVAVVLAADAGPAQAAFTWGAPEARTQAVTSASLAADGTGLLFGFPNPATNNARLAVRPLGGPAGAPQDLPGTTAFCCGAASAGLDAAGNAIILIPGNRTVLYRPAGLGSTPGVPQTLADTPVAVSVAPTGESLVALARGGDLVVASRAAGPSATVDVAGAQNLGVLGPFIGLQLDPDGAAVAVWQQGGGTVQAVRPPGAAFFQAPTPIGSPTANALVYRARMASDPTGHAVLVWEASTSTPGFQPDRAVAAVRSPGGAFGTPVVVGSASVPGYMSDVYPGVTADGDALAAWTQTTGDDSALCMGMGNDINYGAFAAVAHGGAWGPAGALGGTAYPTDTAVRAVASGGHTVAVTMRTLTGGPDECSDAGETSSLTALRFTSAPAVPLALVDAHPLGSNAGTSGTTDVQVSAVSPCGEILESYNIAAAQYIAAGDDPSACTTTPGGPGAGPPLAPAGPKPAPGGAGKPLAPLKLIGKLAAANGDLTLDLSCAGTAQCVWQMTLSVLAGRASSAKARPSAVTLGTLSVKLKPGTRRRASFKLTRAGRTFVRAGKARRVRIAGRLKVGAQSAGFTRTLTLRPAAVKKHR